MTHTTTRLAALAAALLMPLAAAAEEGISVTDAYARVTMPGAPTGAAFMVIENHGTEDDRLVAAASPAAGAVELHTHKHGDDGMMRMMEVPEGFAIPAGGSHALARGGDHVMLMGLTEKLDHGDTLHLTLIFEKGGEIEVEVPIDLKRQPEQGAMGSGTGMGDGQPSH